MDRSNNCCVFNETCGTNKSFPVDQCIPAICYTCCHACYNLKVFCMRVCNYHDGLVDLFDGWLHKVMSVSLVVCIHLISPLLS